ncbi:MAG: hypothetical protein PHY79_22110, partial [Anaerolineae bacterium]|nr:hypothetical protein [Anaerolineae bacterium]MDX9832159.1 hypothetical protein [Anaerolineae bacterium]
CFQGDGLLVPKVLRIEQSNQERSVEGDVHYQSWSYRASESFRELPPAGMLPISGLSKDNG